MINDPVFICGQGRSGTSWLANSVAQSEELVYLRETWLLRRLKDLGDWHDTLYHEWTGFTPWGKSSIDQQAFYQHLGQFYAGLLEELSGGRRYLEKTPEWNIQYFDTLKTLFPDACFVFIYRDGRNYVASTEAKAKRDRKPFEFKRACQRWANAMDIIKSLPEQAAQQKVRVVRYEELIASFDMVFTELCRFIDIAAFTPIPFGANSAFTNARTAEDFNSRWKTWSPSKCDLFSKYAGQQLAEWDYV
ncbi:MAG: sulfotransferase [Gammaproteobacteria bacterium]|nr:sulfotransferase [Gammaproteobacteria bacterium]